MGGADHLREVRSNVRVHGRCQSTPVASCRHEGEEGGEEAGSRSANRLWGRSGGSFIEEGESRGRRKHIFIKQKTLALKDLSFFLFF